MKAGITMTTDNSDNNAVKGGRSAKNKVPNIMRRRRHTHMKVSPQERVLSIINYIFNGAIAFVCAYPFYYIFINSISNNKMSEDGKILWLPKEIHFTNYKNVFGLDDLLPALRVSLARTVIGTALTVLIAAFLGYMFTRETLWGRKFWFRFVAITMYINAGIIPWYLTMKNLHLDNNFWGYILPTIISPFYIILTKTFVESVPKELGEAAEIDGAGTLRIFFSVILPVIKPILATVAIFTAVAQWNSFQDTLLLVTDKGLYTLQFILFNYINGASSLKALLGTNNANIGSILAKSATQTSVRMTVTMIVVFPVLLVYPFFQRYFTKGIMIGAVKG